MMVGFVTRFSRLAEWKPVMVRITAELRVGSPSDIALDDETGPLVDQGCPIFARQARLDAAVVPKGMAALSTADTALALAYSTAHPSYRNRRHRHTVEAHEAVPDSRTVPGLRSRRLSASAPQRHRSASRAEKSGRTHSRPPSRAKRTAGRPQRRSGSRSF